MCRTRRASHTVLYHHRTLLELCGSPFPNQQTPIEDPFLPHPLFIESAIDYRSEAGWLAEVVVLHRALGRPTLLLLTFG